MGGTIQSPSRLSHEAPMTATLPRQSVADEPANETPRSSGALFMSLLRPYRSQLGGYAALLSIVTAIPLGAAIVLGHFVDLVQRRSPARELASFAALYAGLGLAASLMTILVTQRSTSLSWTITDGLRHRLARQVLSADLSFHRDNSPGELVGRADDDVSAMAVVLSQFAAKVLAVIAIGIGATIALLFMEPLLAGPFAVCVALSFWLLWTQRSDAIPSATKKREVMGDLSGFIEERFGGTDDISSLGASAHVLGQLADRSDDLIDATYHATSVNMRIVSSLKVMLSVGEVVMIGWGSALFFSGRIGLGSVIIGWRFAEAMKGPVEQLTWRLSEVQDANGSAERVIALLQSERTYPERVEVLPAGPLSLVFDNVSFTYDDGEDAVLSHLSIEVGAGRSLGLVGRSGSGKTSIGRLALRILSPTEGVLRLGGTDIQCIEEDHLRHRVTAVPQDVQLFPGTIRDNVTLFSDVPDRRVSDALHRVGLDEWLQSQSNGLDTLLLAGSVGAGMSAGQAQLLSLARALVREPDVVVLDEATSRIDPLTQQRIAAATAELLRGRSSIVIAHRLETLAMCDDIAIIERGVVIERGPQTTLTADPSSRFSQLLRAAQVVSGDGSLDELLAES
jgi:ATP-binding cassette, subfamily B, bacterial